ncbi:type VI secretion system contractile sheath large subunit [Thalassomonas sp. RHCl1]|uniref:type VI secretion system contractile sheath large subunit n=1 Tax=Thalassomonas sp. RHCl1 TaxID=2995320 RepID=UPI00248C4C73|nr:type VI secretion system contractile sheath large subunit [Thalassomonas sp. RHCl1]
MESIQKKLSRVRSPRVHITYDVEIGDAIVQRELPLIVGILADLSGKPKEALPPIKERAFVFIDRDNFDDVMAGSQVRLAYSVANAISGEEGATTNLELLFHSIEDFSPLSLVKQIPITSTVYASRCRIRDFMAKLDGNDPLDGILDEILADEAKQTELIGVYEGAEDMSAVEPNELITRMLTEGRMALDDSQKPYALELIGEFALSILKDAGENAAPIASDRMSDRISLIDNQLTRQINLVMHDPAFQSLEATWRGLHFLVMNTETGSHLKLRLFNVSKEDLLKDLQKAVEFDQSSLFKKVYEEEFGTYGGDPFSFLVGDYEFGRHPADVELLEKISGVAASAHAPFISSAYSKLFDMEDFFSLAQPRDLTKIFDSAELIKWRSFRESEDSRYVTLTLPKVLLRLPYGPETVAAEGFDYVEDVDGTDAKKYLWGNPAYILGQRITNAFSLHGWLAAIRGVEGGGLVEGLPTHTFKTAAGDVKLTCPTQVSITDRREKELNDLGFMAILHCKGSDKAAFFGGQTTGLPQKYNTDAANANARISTMLPYVLNASRFAHYIKVIMRDKIGSFQTKENASDYLNNWIGNYVLVDDSAPQEMKASYPLRDSRIDVTDVPGKPGSYRAVVFLRPHFQLEELTTSIRLVAELP